MDAGDAAPQAAVKQSTGTPPTPSSSSTQEPRVSILPRPKSSVMTPKANNSPIDESNSTPRPVAKPQKTLEQREQEYKEARMRLLGDVTFPEEEREAEMEQKYTPAEILKMKIDEALQQNPS